MLSEPSAAEPGHRASASAARTCCSARCSRGAAPLLHPALHRPGPLLPARLAARARRGGTDAGCRGAGSGSRAEKRTTRDELASSRALRSARSSCSASCRPSRQRMRRCGLPSSRAATRPCPSTPSAHSALLWCLAPGRSPLRRPSGTTHRRCPKWVIAVVARGTPPRGLLDVGGARTVARARGSCGGDGASRPSVRIVGGGDARVAPAAAVAADLPAAALN